MSASGVSACLEALPNETLVGILGRLASLDLLPLASINHRFHRLVARLIHRRLVRVGSLPDNDLILECYHPSKKISTPYLFCKYESMKTRGDGVFIDENAPQLSELKSLYSSFRPVMAEENRRPRHRISEEEEDDAQDIAVTEDLFLDEGELFSQLCCQTSLVKTGPRRGLYLSHVNISDGVLRIWREWLGRAVELGSQNDQIMWVDDDHELGIRFRVVPGAVERMPVITGPDDHPPVFYKLYYEELIVRTQKLLLAAEHSEVQEVSHSGKAVVIASM